MRLLVTTQAVDLDDPVLGFFHGWLTEFAKHVETVEVICLKEGRHTLPQNVTVHSLGKERRASRFGYIVAFYRHLWRLRGRYDAVFVHMNPEYVLMGGLWWRLRGKQVVLWRNHKLSGWVIALAVRIANTVCYTSPSAYVAKFGNAVRMPIGIDTTVFAPADAQDAHAALFLGRLDAVKKPDVFLEAMSLAEAASMPIRAHVYGDPTMGREAYAEGLKARYAPLTNTTFYPGVRNADAVQLYQTHGIYVNLTPSGSFDKTIGEAMACGCIVVAANDVLRGVVPDALIVDPTSAQDVVRGLKAAVDLSEVERRTLAAHSRAWVEREHSLRLLVVRLLTKFKEV